MADVEMRFFCHQCSRNIPRVAADYTCPTCNSGDECRGHPDKKYMLNKSFYQGLLKNLAKEQGHQLARLTTTMRSIRNNLSYSMTSAKFSDPWSQFCLDCWEGAWVRRGKEST